MNSFIEQAIQGFEYSMENAIWSQAIFYASAIQAESGFTAESATLLAKAFFMDGQIERAMETLCPFMKTVEPLPAGDLPSGDVRLSSYGVYLYAKCCYYKERYSEAVSALYPSPRSSAPRSNSVFSLDRIDTVSHGAAGLLLLGKSLERLSDRQAAAECFGRCLDLNPLMYEAFERLSVLSFENAKVSIPPTRFAKTYFSDQAFDRLPECTMEPLNAPVPPSLAANTPVKARPPRASARGGIPLTPRRGLSPPSISKPNVSAACRSTSSSDSLCSYLQTMGGALHALNGFDVNVVVDILSRLPAHHQDTAVVQSMLGRAFAEAGRFGEAESAFAGALKLSPSGVVDYIDVYSSVLWQLRKESELAHLCTHGLRVANRATSARLWVAVGNSFSLQKESETAVKFLNRAIQIDAHFAYAHVLMGHEFFAQDKFDRAKQCYSRAIELDSRNYQAFWGLGQVFSRQEEFSNAKFNLVKALEINPKSSTVRYALAAAATALRENELAYQQLSLAVELNPENAPALCQKGLIELTVMRKPELARDTLERALAVANQEPVIFLLLGKIYASGGLREEAMSCFNAALELMKGAKDNYGIKQSIEELDFFGAAEPASAN